MSAETSGSSLYSRMPASGAGAARSANAALISAAVVGRSASIVRSTIEPVGTGTRTAKPLRRPASSGITRPSAFAAPVDVGTRLTAAARARRMSLCGRVEQVLVGGVGVDRGHQPVADADRLVQHLRHGRQAVRRARGVRDDVVDRRVVDLVEVDAEDDVRVDGLGALRRGGEDDLACAGLEVARGIGAGAEAAGGLDDDVDAEIGPRQVGRVGLAAARGSRGRRRAASSPSARTSAAKRP